MGWQAGRTGFVKSRSRFIRCWFVLLGCALIAVSTRAVAETPRLAGAGEGLVSGGGAFAPIEAVFRLDGLSSDPVVLFDHERVDVRVSLVEPDGRTRVLPAFYDGGVVWRVRHSPTRPGKHRITGIRVNGEAGRVRDLEPAEWDVVGFPVDAGQVRVDPSDARRFVTADGRRYFPVGHNVGWSRPGFRAEDLFRRMGAAGENWSRVWMTAFFTGVGMGLNLDWPRPAGGFGVLDLGRARYWDTLVGAAEASGIRLQMVFQHHGQYSTTVNPNWSDNPYNAANGGFLSGPVGFFTDPTARALTRRKLRYAIARWGYSPSIMAWELFNEVQFTDAGRAGNWAEIAAWHAEMAAFIREQDPWGHLITTSSDHFGEAHWEAMDFHQVHNYSADTILSSRNPPNPVAGGGSAVKPVFMGESTPHDASSPPRLWVHAPIWASLMAADAGAACPWWWETIDAEGSYDLFAALSGFVAASGLPDQGTLGKSEPKGSGGGSGALTFGFGGGWGTAVQDTFTVGANAPAGVPGAPAFLQGNYHRQMTPNGYTFLVDYPEAGTFSVRLRTIAMSGAGLQILRNGVVQTNIVFPRSASDRSTNYTATVAVPAGPQTLRIWNPGLDWVEIADITLDPYASELGAYAIGNGGFHAAWIWHRSRIFDTNAVPEVTGVVEVRGLEPGAYSATWWDTFRGRVLSEQRFEVVDAADGIELGTPPFARSIALFARRAGPAPVPLGAAAPVILMEPEDVTVGTGGVATFAVSGNGSAPVTYQWRRNGQAIEGGTRPVLTLADVHEDDAAAYSVVVRNAFGEAVSRDARLEVGNAAGILLRDAVWVDGAFLIRWAAQAGRSYDIQVKGELGDEVWSTVGTVTAESGEGTYRHAGPSGSAGFYRVVGR
jgi:hypothetical protein